MHERVETLKPSKVTCARRILKLGLDHNYMYLPTIVQNAFRLKKI